MRAGKTTIVTGSTGGIGIGISEDVAVKDVLLAAQPAKEFVEVSQIAALTAFLCSGQDAWVAGALLPIDGGWIAH
jgi:3-hydroxybutyrate dehydrogenase